jgi:hypothetical protein
MIGFLILRLLELGIGGREVEQLGFDELVGGATALVGRLEQAKPQRAMMSAGLCFMLVVKRT